MRHLEGLTELQLLSLDYDKITDAGLEHVKGLTELEYLSLNGTQITDAGLEHLRGLTQIRKLDLFETSQNVQALEPGVRDPGLEEI